MRRLIVQILLKSLNFQFHEFFLFPFLALPLDGTMKEDVEKGKICFLCMKSKFGFFNRGMKCELCSRQVCTKCFTKVCIFFTFHFHVNCYFFTTRLFLVLRSLECQLKYFPPPPSSLSGSFVSLCMHK